MKQILNLVRDHNFYILNEYGFSSYDFINEIIENKSYPLTGVVSYVNYGERLAFLNEKFQYQIVDFFIANLALVTVGKALGNAQLTQDFAELKKQDLIQKFFFSVEKRNHEYLDFIKALQTLQGRDNLTLAEVHEFGAEFIKTYTRKRTREVNGVEEIYEQERSLYTNRFVEEFHERSVQIIALLEDLNPVKRVTLREIRTALHNCVVSIKEYTDFSINFQKTLFQCDLVESKIATFQNPELMARWQALRSHYSTDDCDSYDLDSLLSSYFENLGYEESIFTSSFEFFEHELELATAQGYKQPEVVIYQLINRLEHVRYYFKNFKNYEDNNEISNLLLDKDRARLSDKQLSWFNLYLNNLNSLSDKVVANLYYSYLDGNLTLADYLVCLHAYWVQNVNNEVYYAYHQDAPKFIKYKVRYSNVDFFEVKSRAQENNVEFVKEFVQACRDKTLVISTVPSKDPRELANFFVYQGFRATNKVLHTSKLVDLLYSMQTRELSKDNDYGIDRIIVEEGQLFLKSIFSHRELGNFVLVRNSNVLRDCETQEERLAYIYANALENQQLPPAGTVLTPEVLKQRSVDLLTQILEVADFDKTEHLQLS